MSAIKNQPVWLPPPFPTDGRLSLKREQVIINARLQNAEEREYHQQLCVAAGRRVMMPCCKSVHISLFFDGTNNNEKRNTEIDKPPHPSNIARLYHASYRGEEAETTGYYSYYMPGVGTPFPEIGEMDFSDEGLMYATGGEARINWALLRIVDALSHTLTRVYVNDDYAQSLIFNQLKLPVGLHGSARRKAVFDGLFANLRRKVKYHQPRLLKVKLFIYGFSRGAAEARTFMNWLTDIFDTPEQAGEVRGPSLLGLPVCIEFAGLFDTVASVGIAHVAPQMDGHMGWADNTQALPDAAHWPGLLKRCYHFVSAHEQRLCFPLDSVRRTDGTYPPGTVEVIYPGVHSDIGGGYSPGDQGKALQGEQLLSQITLHDMYALALAAGAPFTYPEQDVINKFERQHFYKMFSPLSKSEFYISQDVIQRFNAWRFTLNIAPEADTAAGEEYIPLAGSTPLEAVMEEQTAWLTAWRIGRYANGSYARQPFYQAAKAWSYDEDPQRYDENIRARQERQRKIEYRRLNGERQLPGEPIFDPAMNCRQLTEAAQEFADDYRSGALTVGLARKSHSIAQLWLDDVAGKAVYVLNVDDEAAEYQRIKTQAQALLKRLFADDAGRTVHDHEMARVCALFDEQIHDSRAWFMHSSLGAREMWSGYFRYRMIYTGDRASKAMTLFEIGEQGLNLLTGMFLFNLTSHDRASADPESSSPLGGRPPERMAKKASASVIEAVREAVIRRSRKLLRDTLSGLPVPLAYSEEDKPHNCCVIPVGGDGKADSQIQVALVSPQQDLLWLREERARVELVKWEQKNENVRRYFEENNIRLLG